MDPNCHTKWVPWNALVRIGPSGPLVTGKITHAEHLNSFFLAGFFSAFPFSFDLPLLLQNSWDFPCAQLATHVRPTEGPKGERSMRWNNAPTVSNANF